MISVKLATPSLLKKKVFWNKRYDIIIYVHGVTNKILSRDSNYIVDVVCQQSLHFYEMHFFLHFMKEVIIISIL